MGDRPWQLGWLYDRDTEQMLTVQERLVLYERELRALCCYYWHCHMQCPISNCKVSILNLIAKILTFFSILYSRRQCRSFLAKCSPVWPWSILVTMSGNCVSLDENYLPDKVQYGMYHFAVIVPMRNNSKKRNDIWRGPAVTRKMNESLMFLRMVEWHVWYT